MGSEKVTMEHVKKMLSEARQEAAYLSAELKHKAGKRNAALREIFRIRSREHHLKGEVKKLDMEAYKINMKLRGKQRVLENARRLGIV